MFKKVVASGLSLMMVLSSTGYQQLVQVHAETNMLSKQLSGIKSVEADKSECCLGNIHKWIQRKINFLG